MNVSVRYKRINIVRQLVSLGRVVGMQRGVLEVEAAAMRRQLRRARRAARRLPRRALRCGHALVSSTNLTLQNKRLTRKNKKIYSGIARFNIFVHMGWLARCNITTTQKTDVKREQFRVATLHARVANSFATLVVVVVVEATVSATPLLARILRENVCHLII